MVTEEPELEAWGLYGVQAPHGPSRQTALEKHGPILQNKLIYREKKEQYNLITHYLQKRRVCKELHVEYFNKSSNLTDLRRKFVLARLSQEHGKSYNTHGS